LQEGEPMSTATATQCACGQPMAEEGRVLVCAHCDRPCKRLRGTCVNCSRMTVKR
jgi:hypothetical protein